MMYVTDSRTSGQGQHNSSHLYTQIPWRKTISHTSYVICMFRQWQQEVNKNNDNYDTPWKTKEVFDSLDVAYSNFYNPSEHLAIDEVVVLFRGRLQSSCLSPQNTNISELKFTNCVTLMATHMTQKCNSRKTENGLQHTWQQPMLQWNNW